MSQSLTKGAYHINIAKQYLEAFSVECRQSAKNMANAWVQKLAWLENDIYRSLTPEGQQLFKEEIKNGDTLFFEGLSENLLRMTPDQRELMERISEALLKGEMIEFVK